MWNTIATQISEHLHADFKISTTSSVGGGCINQAYVISNGQQSFFVKTNRADLAAMFAVEAQGLQVMGATNTIAIPEVIGYGVAANQAYLILSHFSSGQANNQSMRLFGQQLAKMHQHTQTQFGFSVDNYIGSTPQPNTLNDDWVDFWRMRLAYQLDLTGNRTLQQQGQQLLTELDKFFVTYQPQASLLHGDLWSGNYAINEQGQPVLFDPATYYGDRETDIAMTELFGGFSRDFYKAYQATWALDKDYVYRKPLYNLYHILNHYNLFGGGYLSQSSRLIEQLLTSQP